MTPEQVKAFRTEHGLTRRQLAVLLGVAPGTVRNWEQGVRNMPAPTDLAIRRVTRAMIAQARRRR